MAGTPLGQAFVRISPDTSGFGRDLERGAGGQGERAALAIGTRIGRHLHAGIVGPLGGLGGKLAGVFAGLATIEVFKGLINDARESAKVARVTEAVIKSTGSAAHVSAKQVGELATAISDKTGKDDEAIQSGENLLLTFTNIKNETGKGNDVFNQASAAIIDMTAALNDGAVSTDLVKASAIQLGKALNDPIAGVTALKKVGVSFTAQQQDQIKTLVQSGNTLAAQKIILREVGREFGGAARASTDPMERLTVIVGNLKEQIGGALLPVVTRAAGVLESQWVPAISAAFDKLNVQGKVSTLVGDLTRLATTIIHGVTPGVKDMATAVVNLYHFALQLGTALGPLVIAFGKLTIAASIVGFNALAQALASITGIMANHQTLVLTLAAAYAIHLAGGLARVIFLARAAVWNTLAAAINLVFGATERAAAGFTAMAAAQGAATLGVGLLIAGLISHYEAWQRAGKKTAESIGQDMKSINKNSAEALNALAAKFQKQADQMAKNEHILKEQGKHYQGASKDIQNLEKAHDALIVKSQKVAGATAELSREFGFSESRVTSLANAAKVDLSGSFDKVNDKFGKYVSTLNSGGAKQTALVGDMKDLAGAAGDAQKQVQALKQALDDLTGKQLDVNEATRNYQSAIDDLTDSASKNGKTLDVTNEKGRANSEALDKIATSIKDMITAEVAAGTSTQQVTNDFAGMYNQLLLSAEQLGLTKQQAEAYALSLGLVPDQVNVLIAAAGATQSTDQVNALNGAIGALSGKTVPVNQQGALLAQAQVAGLNQRIAEMQGKIVTIQQQGADGAASRIRFLQGEIDRLRSKAITIDALIAFHAQGLSGKDLRQARLLAGLSSARGNLFLNSFAGGGIAKILPPGPTLYQWREPSTGGEAFIPMGSGHRLRSTAILGEVARRFGYKLTAAAGGADMLGWSPPAPKTAGGAAAAQRMHPADLAAIAGRPMRVDVYLDGKVIDSRIGSAANLRARGG